MPVSSFSDQKVGDWTEQEAPLAQPSGQRARRQGKSRPARIQALGICRELTTSDPRIAEVEAAALGNIGVAQFRLGRLDEALASHHLALDKHRLVGNRSNTTQVLENIADVQRLKGELTGALQTYRQALATRVVLGDKHREADTRRDIGDVLHALGLTSDAREEWLQSLEHYERLSYTELAEKISQRLASAAP